MGRKKEAAEVQQSRQRVARILDEHLAGPRIDRQAVTLFAREQHDATGPRWLVRRQARKFLHGPTERLLSTEDQRRLAAVRERLAEQDTTRRNTRDSDYSLRERSRLLLQAKFKSGLDNEKKRDMYDKAGYTEKEIDGITKKDSGKTALADIALSSVSYGVGLIGLLKDNIANSIPNSNIAMAATGAAYLGSFLLLTRQNLRLTKEFGASFNFWLTETFGIGNRLLPEKLRDRLAQLVPVGADMLTRLAFLGTVAGFTGDDHKVIAANTLNAGLNVIYAGGVAEGLRRKKKKKAKIESSKTPTQD